MSTQNDERVYIVAGSFMEFRDYEKRKVAEAKSSGLNYPRYIYVNDANILRGLSNIKGFYIGSYETRKDLAEIKEQIGIIKWRIGSISFVEVHVMGVRQNPSTDYIVRDRILSKDSSKLSEVTIEFTQAPPKGSPVTITNVKGDNFFVVGDGAIRTFHAVFT